MQHIVFLFFSLLSHVGASLFFAKPRFNKPLTAAIWSVYGLIFLLLPPVAPVVNYFVSLALYTLLFFLTTTGRWEEKGFLLLSYAGAYACFGALYQMIAFSLDDVLGNCVAAFLLMGAMQGILYVFFLPAFRKVAHLIRKGWGRFYAVAVSFLVLLSVQGLFDIEGPLDVKTAVVFLLTLVTYCLAYVLIFVSLKNMAELTREHQRLLLNELLQAQVDARAGEAELVRRNRHDMRHHYQAMLLLAENGETEKLVEYLKLQSEAVEERVSERFCENETVNNNLNVFQKKAADRGIAIEICAAVKPELSVPSPALVTVVANVLENAPNAAEDAGKSGAFIKVAVKHKSSRLVIYCENSCSRYLHFEEMPEYLQGIGIRSVISTAERYHGACRFSARDGVFRCSVVMDE